jgi:MFS family permease
MTPDAASAHAPGTGTAPDAAQARPGTSWAITVPVFRKYLGARGLALLGNALSLVAMPLLAYRLTGSAALTALVASGTFWPYLIFGLPAGALADRLNRRTVMVWASVLGALVLATVPAAALADLLTYPHLLIAELVVASLFVFSDAASFGVLPQLVGRSGLASATSALMIVHSSLMLVGPALAGLLIAVADPSLVIAVDVVAYLLVALFLSRLSWSDVDVSEQRYPSTVTGDMAEGLRFIWRHQVIRWLTIFGFGARPGVAWRGWTVGGGGGRAGGPGRRCPPAGLALRGQRVGDLDRKLDAPCLAAVVRSRADHLVRTPAVDPVLLALSTARELVPVLILVAVFQIPLMALILNGMVARSVLTPNRLQSRVNTTARMVAGGGGPFGAVLAGAVAEAAGTEWALRAVGVGLLVSLADVLIVGVHRYPRLRDLQSGGPS